MKYPFVASDLDGTIVKHSDFELYDDTKNAINHYQVVSNNRFTLVTGRYFGMMKHYVNELHIKLPVIAANGSAIVDPITHKVLYKKTLSNDVVVALLDFFETNNIYISIHTPLVIVGLKDNERCVAYREYAKDWPAGDQPDIDEYESWAQLRAAIMDGKYDVLKFTASLPLAEKDTTGTKIYTFCEEHGWYHPSATILDRYLIDIMDGGISKATGILAWSEIMNVPAPDIVVVGDNNNYIEMVTQAKLGVAVKNASDKLLQVAKKIVPAIHDNGVGVLLEDIMNGK